MQEWCTCNASFKMHSYKRLIEWRTNHRHEPHSEPDPAPQGSMSVTERSYQSEPVELRLGFQKSL